MPKKYKSFKDVKPGDWATDYGDEEFEVIDKGTSAAMLKKYYHQLDIGQEELETCGVHPRTNCIICRDNDRIGLVLIYVYGGEGALVYGDGKPTSLHAVHGADAIPILQGGMKSNADSRYKIPKRFKTEGNGSSVIITDTLTNKSVDIGLCDYHGALKILEAFFPAD